MLVGGMAAVAHGSAQLTRDLDICVPLESDNFLRLQTALRPLNPRVRAGRERVRLNLDEMIRAKEAMGRPRDILAATELRAILEKKNQDGQPG